MRSLGTRGVTADAEPYQFQNKVPDEFYDFFARRTQRSSSAVATLMISRAFESCLDSSKSGHEAGDRVPVKRQLDLSRFATQLQRRSVIVAMIAVP